ncbi:Proline/betaine transporter [Pandoraea eparura]|uniref:Proline/betaine transporter n=1 Tax=Pandoraea eparura TaxID=2508291 RepID=A0A5E4RGR9_9BURK|nr:hypothetical protein [Pandoraea eparura]VVD62043.1 Proline/betaine transporter [Pandoraea eparura]
MQSWTQSHLRNRDTLKGIGINITEVFPLRIRATGLAIVYGLGVSVLGGFAQFIATWPIGVTGSKLAPAGYVIAVSPVSMVAVFMSREMKGTALA